jgi:predicted ArsR family transcriptional regulator
VDHEAAGNAAVLTVIAMPREGSKLAAVVDLLRREDDATIDQLADAMGWLPHTTRAALTGLRKRGFEIDRRKAKDERAGAYVIVDDSAAAER